MGEGFVCIRGGVFVCIFAGHRLFTFSVGWVLLLCFAGFLILFMC